MAKALAGGGATVYILGRRASALEAAASSHTNIRPLVCDVTSKASLQNAVDAISAEVGYVNLVIANSGVLGPYQSFGGDGGPLPSIRALRARLFDDVSLDAFNEPLHVNVTGAYFTMLAFLELLDAGNRNALKGGFGKPAGAGEGGEVPLVQSQVIFTGSVGSYSRERASPPAYVASKSAVAQLAQHAATNLAPYQIRVNTLAPGCEYFFFFPLRHLFHGAMNLHLCSLRRRCCLYKERTDVQLMK
jgi:NAD(P)-dependent dehydrogenase (short-subunit alcohol dehydrogenase family)